MGYHKSVVIAILILNFPFLNAQNKSGYNFGVNITTTSLNYNGTKIKPQLPFGFHFGMNYEIFLNRKIGFQTGFILSAKGAEYKIDNSDYLIDPYYIEIPVNLVLKFGNKPSLNMSIFAGPYFSSTFSGYKIEPGGGIQKLAFGPGENKDLKYIDTGFNFGVNLNIRSSIFSIQYGVGLRNLSPKSNTELINRVFGISFVQLTGNKS
jgi:Outer membrane protein beta-barrel domain